MVSLNCSVDGWIPINKNLWSFSFILVLAGLAFIILTILYLLIDVYKWFTGEPFLWLGQLLARKFDLYGKLTPSIDNEDFLHGYIDGVVSCAYTDIISNVITCIFSNLNFTDKNNPSYRLLRIISNNLKALNNLLKKSSTSFYYDQQEPTIADYFVFEAFTLARDYHEIVLPNEEDRQALIKHEQIMKERPALANYFSKGLLFKRITGSSKESEYMATLAETKK
ncbi:unnamed protein product [Rotaria sp. Silwood1]|nr:unnamed protein product [Rotaria sp. Silwood1]